MSWSPSLTSIARKRCTKKKKKKKQKTTSISKITNSYYDTNITFHDGDFYVQYCVNADGDIGSADESFSTSSSSSEGASGYYKENVKDDPNLNRISWDEYFRFPNTPLSEEDDYSISDYTPLSEDDYTIGDYTVSVEDGFIAEELLPGEAADDEESIEEEEFLPQESIDADTEDEIEPQMRKRRRRQSRKKLASKGRKLFGGEKMNVNQDEQKEDAYYDQLWNKRYDELKAYVASEGDCLVPYEYKDNPYLGHWVHNQRYLHKSQQLRQDRRQKLEKLGFVWHFNDIHEKQWNQRFQELKAFAAERGHCRVPKDYEENPSLGLWVMHQRTMYRTQQLRKDRHHRLEEIGFVWNVLNSKKKKMAKHQKPDTLQATAMSDGIHEKQWNQKHEELKAYASVVGNCLVPKDYEENPSLGIWVSNQRTQYKTRQLRKDRQCKLEKLGFVWQFNDINEKQWNQRYQELKAFAAARGHCRVPKDYEENPSLGLWVMHQRTMYRTQQLRKDRQHSLEEIGFVWSVYDARRKSLDAVTKAEKDPDERWNQMYKNLCAKVDVHGDCLVPPDTHKHERAVLWMAQQRRLYREGILSDERKHKLDQLGFVWEQRRKRKHKLDKLRCVLGQRQKGKIQSDSIIEKRWNQKYEELQAYKAFTGDCLVPIYNEENPKLGLWVKTQRQMYMKQQLRKDRMQRLQKLGFVWSVNKDKTEKESKDKTEKESKEEKMAASRPKPHDQCEEQRSPKEVEHQSFARRRTKPQQRHEEQWNLKYDELKVYVAEMGDCLVSQYSGTKHQRLGEWVQSQRKWYKKGTLREDRKRKLEKLGFVWAPRKAKTVSHENEDEGEEEGVFGVKDRHDELWDQRYRQLKAYKAANGDCLVPKGYMADGARLGKWVSTQRWLYSTQRLRKDRELKLQRLGFAWNGTYR